MKLQLEIYEQGYSDMSLLKEFWMTEWTRVMKDLVGEGISQQIFNSQNYFYVIKLDQQIIGVMSSAWQNVNEVACNDEYYSAWPEAIAHLKSKGIQHFHKMGMLVANKKLIPKAFRFSSVIISCGLKYAYSYLDCQAVVAFARTDLTVFQSTLSCGFKNIKSGLYMHGVPVNFIKIRKSDFESVKINEQTFVINNLWDRRLDLTSQSHASRKAA